ncbi:MAG: type 4a pilus biogenesis protein PilO [Gammaproteobacteria bacterium]|nr:type 4a pilus biogenesis protein PilO [Gammaproteobacteria bacterium]
MLTDDLKNLDINDIASWPIPIKVVGAIIVSALILALSYWFFIQDQLDALDKAGRKEQELRATFLMKKSLAINLPAYRQQMTDMEEDFGVMLRQLPNKTEIPELLIDITQAGLSRGLKFKLVKPGVKIYSDFYATLPIDLNVMGTYHELGQFISDLAALPRIVSLGNIDISPLDKKLSMKTIALTYHYLDEEEIAAQSAAKNKKKRRRGRR